jgi:hypothetical protein
MRSKQVTVLVAFSLFLILLGLASAQSAWTPRAVTDDALVRMPGTQPEQVTLEAPGRCLNCHAGYNTEVEPGFAWKGSMMAQASRDFLFWACMTVAAQDSIWAVGRPNATDICERCHFPQGWLEGRSDPTNASLMTGADYDGVQCDFCHTVYDPFFEATFTSTPAGPDPNNYFDETNASSTPSQSAASATYAEDALQAQGVSLFSGQSFYGSDNYPVSPLYDENGAGQYFVSAGSDKRASFADAEARHRMLYSRYHKSAYFCSTCHDVSNPVLANLAYADTLPGPGAPVLNTEENPAYSYYHVERTSSEFMLSDYAQPGGAPGLGPFAPSVFDTSQPGNNIAMCQDCHMRDVVGVACDKKGVPVRPNESVEHPQSGQPLHDQTGGNIWVSYVLASAAAGSPQPDDTNASLLHKGPAVLTLDLTQGEGIDPVALLAGVDRAKQQLLLAASIQNVSYDGGTGALSFRIQNQTGHKLISGFPEGRRMFVNIKAYAGDTLIYEVNPYHDAAGTLKGLSYPYSGAPLPNPAPLGANEVHIDELVYEMHPSSSDLTGEDHTFHFALATDRYKDNRIPPKGFRLGDPNDADPDDAWGRLSQPRWHGADAPGMYTAAEYAGGYDDVSLSIGAGADYVEINLYYQTTSREYIEFLRDEIKGTGNLTLPETPGVPGPGDPAHYVIQSDAFFAQLKEWGNTIWELWTHNMDVPGAAPFLMTQGTWGVPSAGCTAPTPTLLEAIPGNQQVQLNWTEIPGDPNIVGYKLYYDQAGKAQLVADITTAPFNTYTDSGLTNGQQYCYKLTTYYSAACESGFSNIECATPQNQGQTTDPAGVTTIQTGLWGGKGKNKTFTLTSTFAPGDAVVIRARVTDASGNPIANATVEVTIGGPETATLNSNPSDADGWAEATWQTQKPNKKGQGGTIPGPYTSTTTNVTASGYHWDSVTTSVHFSIQ